MKRGAALFSALFMISSLLPAIELKEVMERLREKENQISNLTFHFAQTIEFEAVGEPSEISGTAIVSRGNKMRISKQSPQEQVTVSNGKKVWVYTPAFSQVWVGTWSDWTKSDSLTKGLIPLNNFVDELESNYNLTLVQSDKEGEVLLKAVPKKNGGFDMMIRVSTSLWLPVKTVYNSDTAKVETVLSHFELNKNLPGDEFDFKSPPGTEEISFN